LPDDMAALHAAAFAGSRPWSAAEFAGLLENPGCFAVGTLDCFALVRVVLDEAELLTIATHPACLRQGLARACMTNWIGLAQQHGATRAFLEVATDNVPAIALYQASGFESCGTRLGYYRRENAACVDAQMMARDLT
jgi:[ribosomal protein S18]-alanine N-acetyltransferase